MSVVPILLKMATESINSKPDQNHILFFFLLSLLEGILTKIHSFLV